MEVILIQHRSIVVERIAPPAESKIALPPWGWLAVVISICILAVCAGSYLVTQ